MNRELDKNEAISYGKFIQGAYVMFKRDPANLKPAPQPGDIPPPYEFVAWIHMSDFTLPGMPLQRKFYGFVARSKDTEQDFVLAIRGTEGLIEWWDDGAAYLVPFSQVPHIGRVAHGFDRIYSTLKIEPHPQTAAAEVAAGTPAELQGSFADQLEQLHLRLEKASPRKLTLSETRDRPQRRYIVAGHSLGGALSTLFAMENKEKQKFDIQTICTFASPRVGNMQFVRTFNLLPFASWRIANTCDLVPKLPLHIPIILDYEHVNTAYEFSSAGWVKGNPVCWHSMETYMHWLDGTLPVDPSCK
jgi:hypothetical protein